MPDNQARKPGDPMATNHPAKNKSAVFRLFLNANKKHRRVFRNPAENRKPNPSPAIKPPIKDISVPSQKIVNQIAARYGS